MTHEYVIALSGTIHSALDSAETPTAVAWAADHVLAVGADEVVRSISRGDSTFLDLGGCHVTALPSDPERADLLVRESGLMTGPDLSRMLMTTGWLDPGSGLETGSPADLAFWAPQPHYHLMAVVRGGAFIEGDEHMGPFSAPASP